MGRLYDTDILLGSEQQAALLRRLAAGERVNDVAAERLHRQPDIDTRLARLAVAGG